MNIRDFVKLLFAVGRSAIPAPRAPYHWTPRGAEGAAAARRRRQIERGTLNRFNGLWRS